jgi:hypothetical protein
MLPQKELRQSITEFWISLTDKVLLQPFNESERQRADYLGCQQQPLLGCGPAPCRPLGPVVSTGPRRKLRETSHPSKSVSHHGHTKTIGVTKVDIGRRARTEPWPKPSSRGFRTTHATLSVSAPPRPTRCSNKKNSDNQSRSLDQPNGQA